MTSKPHSVLLYIHIVCHFTLLVKKYICTGCLETCHPRASKKKVPLINALFILIKKTKTLEKPRKRLTKNLYIEALLKKYSSTQQQHLRDELNFLACAFLKSIAVSPQLCSLSYLMRAMLQNDQLLQHKQFLQLKFPV